MVVWLNKCSKTLIYFEFSEKLDRILVIFCIPYSIRPPQTGWRLLARSTAPGTSVEDRKKHLKVLQIKWHPDKNPDQEVVAKGVFQLLVEKKECGIGQFGANREYIYSDIIPRNLLRQIYPNIHSGSFFDETKMNI